MGKDIDRVAAILVWATLPEATKSCYELMACGCKKGWHGAATQCTSQCVYSEDCHAAPQTGCATFNDCNVGRLTFFASF